MKKNSQLKATLQSAGLCNASGKTLATSVLTIILSILADLAAKLGGPASQVAFTLCRPVRLLGMVMQDFDRQQHLAWLDRIGDEAQAASRYRGLDRAGVVEVALGRRRIERKG